MQGYVAAAFFLVTSGMTLFYNFMLIVGISSTPSAAYLIPQTVILFVSCVILIGCYVSFMQWQNLMG